MQMKKETIEKNMLLTYWVQIYILVINFKKWVHEVPKDFN